VQFTDKSKNFPSSWNWNFGDGGTSTLQDPVYTYSAPGTYNVSLTVTNSAGNNTMTQMGCITVLPVVLTVNGYVSDPLNLSMANLEALPLISENVSYTPMGGGDMEYMNVTGASLNALLNESVPLNGAVSATFTGSDGFGTTIPLSTIQGDNGSIIAFNAPPDGSLRNIIPSQGGPMQWTYDLASITVNGPMPVANFTANATSGTAPFTVQFTDTSLYEPTSWMWSLGDGNISTSQSPVHTYSTAGNYSVSLTATNAAGSNSKIMMKYITVSQPVLPVANFTANVTSGIAPLTVQFTDTSSNATSWLWSFGDGNTSVVESPVYTYTVPGSYNVSLTATNLEGNNTMTRTGCISVG
jgi:PKD repeat protein